MLFATLDPAELCRSLCKCFRRRFPSTAPVTTCCHVIPISPVSCVIKVNQLLLHITCKISVCIFKKNDMFEIIPPIFLYSAPEVWASEIPTTIRSPAIFRLLLRDAYISFTIDRINVHIHCIAKGDIVHGKNTSIQPSVSVINASELIATTLPVSSTRTRTL